MHLQQEASSCSVSEGVVWLPLGESMLSFSDSVKMNLALFVQRPVICDGWTHRPSFVLFSVTEDVIDNLPAAVRKAEFN